MDTIIRSLASQNDYRACIDLQRETWGEHFGEHVPATILQISQKVGGVAAGAFDASGRMLGLVFGVTGWRDGELCHWSHMLAVRDEFRDQGIGEVLKDFQRSELLARGVRVMFWTYDPLVARNAYFNLQKIGAEVVEYVKDMYGEDQASTTDSVIGSDRFVVRWSMETRGSDFVPETWESAALAMAQDPVRGSEPVLIEHSSHEPMLKVEIPSDIQSLKMVMPDVARRWRVSTRQIFRTYIGEGYRVAAFHRETDSFRCYYYLTSQPHVKDD